MEAPERTRVWPPQHRSLRFSRAISPDCSSMLCRTNLMAPTSIKSPRSVKRLGDLIDVGAIKFVRHNIEEQSGDMALENLSDLCCGGQTRVLSGASIEPEHHALDHGAFPP